MDNYQLTKKLAENPLLGRDASELIPELRRVKYQSHVIFYLKNNGQVIIIRVLRKEMDFKLHL